MSTEMSDNFAVFILTHGRPNNVITYRTLEKQGYTGPVYIIIDNEDETADEYRRIYGDKVIMFDKLAISKTFDTGDNFDDRRTIVYARNACFGIAEGLGIKYFLQLDDDYSGFWYKFSSSLTFKDRQAGNLDRLFSAMLDYYKGINALSIAFGQGGDLLGGGKSTTIKRLWLKRKCMNTFFCSTDRSFLFVGRVNEDANTFSSLGTRGALMFTIFNATIIQNQTQSTEGGMSNVYLNEGTYIKSFYPVMYSPSFVDIYMMGQTNKRLHHRINWNNAAPRIVDEKYRKVNQDV